MDKQRTHGGYTRFSTPMQQPGKMNQISPSIGANSRIKTVQFPKKFSDHNHPYLINHVPAPRKSRSGLVILNAGKKDIPREILILNVSNHEGIIYTAIKSELPYSRNRLKDCTKKQTASEEEFRDLKDYEMTKEDKEAAQALFALAQTPTDTDLNLTSQEPPYI